MRFYDKFYNDKSEDEFYKMRPSEKYAGQSRKSRLESWIKKCLEVAIEANKQNIGEQEDTLLKLRVRLANGEDSVLRKIIETRHVIDEAKKQLPMLEEELNIMFEEGELNE